MDEYDRNSQKAVTLFLHKDDKYLLIKRSPSKKVDPGRLNGIGGRCESGENYVDTAIRETAEESGQIVTAEQIKLAGVVTLEGGYPTDWVMCFFIINVDSFDVIPEDGDDGELLWLTEEEIFSDKYERVDDLNFCFKDMISNKGTVFLSAKLDEKQKVIYHTKNYLK
ncbi:MAG: NUDIX domain-containing protein [Candidatus Shapirobacteria bacterium]|jgi:8-oxo-dGTP pyrophosphatase MutT (NUDIX family)